MASSFDQRSGSSASRPRDVVDFASYNQNRAAYQADSAQEGGFAPDAAYEQRFQEAQQSWQPYGAPGEFEGAYGDQAVGFDTYGLQEKPKRRNRVKDPRKGQYYRSLRKLVLFFVMVLLLFVAYVLVVHSPLFEIQSINANPTEHVTSEEISDLAAVPAGSTLFGFDEKGIEERLLSNPWVASVKLVRQPPHTLAIEVEEREGAAVVMLTNGIEAWLIADDGYWIMPLQLQDAVDAAADQAAADGADQAAGEGAEPPADQAVAQAAPKTPIEQAREYAESQGLVYVSWVSPLIKPQAGVKCTDPGVLGVMTYLEEFTGALRVMIEAAKASSAESISIVLTNGIEVSLGSPQDIVLKERVIMGLLEVYVGQMTYINVRTPASPVWRGLDASVAGAIPSEGGGTAFDSVSFATEADYAAAEAAAEAARLEQQQAERQEEYVSTGALVGTAEGGPGGPLDWGGYYSDSGVWIYAYYDSNGNWINGYYEANGEWVRIS